MATTQGNSTNRLVIALLVAIIVLPLVVVVVAVLGLIGLGAVAGAGTYVAVQQTVFDDKRNTVRREVGALWAEARSLKGQGALVPCGSDAEAAAALADEPDLKSTPGGHGWDDCLVGFGASSSPVYGRYWIEVAPDGAYTVHGIVDLDADGILAHFVADEGGDIQMISTADVY